MLRRSLSGTPSSTTAALLVAPLVSSPTRAFDSPPTRQEASRRWFARSPMWLVPLRNTQQDKALIDIVTKCYFQHPRCAYVVHAHRGARKSCVAQRCAQRSELFLRPFAIRITYIIPYGIDCEQTESVINRHIWSDQRRDMFLTAFWVLAALALWVLWCSDNDADEPLLKSLPMGLALVVGALIVRLALGRGRVFIVDDPGCVTLADSRRLLGFLDATAKRCPIVILTYNEGLDHCFPDNAALSRRYEQFPSPKVEELADVLRHVALDPVKPLPQLAATDITAVRAAARYNLEHHALSVRWWLDLARHASKDSAAKSLDAATVKRLSRDRSFLWHTVLFLDCAAHQAFRPECLGFSKPLTDEQKMTVAKLVLPLDATDEQRQEMVKRLPAECPRRLALAWAMVLTAKSGDVQHVKDLRSKLTTAYIPEKEGREGLAYEHFIVPLVNAIDEYICAHTERK